MQPKYDSNGVKIYHGNCLDILKKLEPKSVQTCVTSPPYWGMRNYESETEQVGLEETPSEYVKKMVEVFRGVKEVLKDDGTVWLNIGDCYAGNCSRTSAGRAGFGAKRDGVYFRGGDGLKAKDLAGMPWRVAFGLQDDGWYLRSDIIWAKSNPVPASVKDRPTSSHEYMFLLSKQPKYYYDYIAIKEEATSKSKNNEKYGGVKNKRSVWTVPVRAYRGAHTATFPPELITPCILAGSKKGDTVLDPFMGSGTTGLVARELGRKSIGCELSEEYIKVAEERLSQKEVAKIEKS